MEMRHSAPISLSSPEYQNHVESTLGGFSSDDNNGVFGRSELFWIENADDPMYQRIFKTDALGVEERVDRRVARLQNSLYDYSDAHQANVEELLKTDYSALLVPSETDEDTPYLSALRNLPHDEFITFLRNYNAASQSIFEEFEASVDSQKKAYLTAFRSRVAAGQLPDVADSVENKLRDTKFKPVDLFAEADDHDEASGWFEPWRLQAAVRLGLSVIWRKHTFNHESTHAGAGRTAMGVDTEFDDYEEEAPTRLSRRILMRLGLRKPKRDEEDTFSTVDFPRTGLRLGDRFTWLDEATTEHVAQLLSQDEVSSHGVEQIRELIDNEEIEQAYQAERELLAVILESGRKPIELMTVLEAYFEDYDPDKPAGTRAEKRMALHKAITEAYGPGFLVKLDAYLAQLEEVVDHDEAILTVAELIQVDPSLLDSPCAIPATGLAVYRPEIFQQVREIATSKHSHSAQRTLENGSTEDYTQTNLRSSFLLPDGVAVKINAGINQDNEERYINVTVTKGEIHVVYTGIPALGEWLRSERDADEATADQPETADIIELDESFTPFSRELKRHIFGARINHGFTEGEIDAVSDLISALHNRPTRS